MAVSPALGDAIKDLRSVQASFLTDFQAVLADMHGTVRSAHDHVQTKQEEARGYEEGIRRLEDVIGKHAPATAAATAVCVWGWVGAVVPSFLPL